MDKSEGSNLGVWIANQANGGSTISVRGANPQGGAPTYYSAKFSRKKHEKNWTEKGGKHPKSYYVDQPLQAY